VGLSVTRDIHRVSSEKVEERVLFWLAFCEREKTLVEIGNSRFGQPGGPPPTQACERQRKAECESKAEAKEEQDSGNSQAFLRKRVRVHSHDKNDCREKSRQRDNRGAPRKGRPAEARLQRPQISIYLFQWIHAAAFLTV